MKVCDNFVGRKSVVSQMNSDELWDTLPKGTTWWNGWWDDLGTASIDTFWKQFIHSIWKDYPDVEKAHGFEFWGNTLHSFKSKDLGIHKDKDESLFERTGEIITPDFGAVYYPSPMDYDGGYLEIYNEDSFDKVERLAPVQDRLVMFDPSYYHRVTPIYNGVRRAFVVNLWASNLPEIGRGNEVQ